ncbi:hypothetical protein TRICI_000193 [Trichomonascus ciferrii]|uniref:Luciferase domain-containing protein n=1 Tax=Trichomonascus ciferrii TaxID=44093 RepID=A0A642VE54_9ASCO|nr:hypothetical protein TRICI_000193 [Trichomonascus ciferrii]
MNRSYLNASLAIGGGTLALYYVVRDYRAWKVVALHGGAPVNVLGYLVSTLSILVLRGDRRNPKQIKDTVGGKGFLDPEAVEKRSGPVPAVAKWKVPQRQVTEKQPDNSEGLAEQFYEQAIEKHGLQLEPSLVENHISALFSNKRDPEHELIHRHPTDGTFHLLVHPQDAKVIIENNWGELFSVPPGWVRNNGETVLLYCPRSQEDITVFHKFLDASAAFIKSQDSN